MAVQEGIYFRRGVSPPGFFTLLLLQATTADAASVKRLVGELWTVYDDLKKGTVSDLPGLPLPTGELQVLLGFGARARNLNVSPQFRIPAVLGAVGARFNAAVPDAPVASGTHHSGVKFGNGGDHQELADVDFVVQFTATTPLAVERAVVETWKVLLDPKRGGALRIVGFYSGSQRDDQRSWIDFHDGLSNLAPDERRGVILIGGNNASETSHWTHNGTFLAFIRLAVDLGVWQGLGRARQEELVGRDKLTGCPIESFIPGTRRTMGCPVAPPRTVKEPIFDPGARRPPPDAATLATWDPPRYGGTDTTVTMSHIRRSNKRATASHDPASLRIFRQGYPYIESLRHHPHVRVGLNFVSFQNTPRRLIPMLTSPTWLGATNFGGFDENGPAEDPFVSAYAAGIFFVPPHAAGEWFPGSRMLG